MTAKMQGPHNHGGLSHDGTAYEPDDNGQIEVPEFVIPHAFAHGFTLVTEAPADPLGDKTPLDLTKLKKAELVAHAKDTLDLDLDSTKTNKDLIAEIEAAALARTTPADPLGE